MDSVDHSRTTDRCDGRGLSGRGTFELYDATCCPSAFTAFRLRQYVLHKPSHLDEISEPVAITEPDTPKSED